MSLVQALPTKRHADELRNASVAGTMLGTAGNFQVRRVTSIEDYRQCEALQVRVWGANDVVFVPALVLITAQQNGGMVLGAFSDEDKLIGFVCSFPGLTDSGLVKQCSQLMVVDPAYQKQGLGYQLKLMQRRVALSQGIGLITWTFDPLQGVNANLNINKLGCVSSQYLIDIYGTAKSGLNAGMSTDRLVAEWWIEDDAVTAHPTGKQACTLAEAHQINEVVRHPSSGFPISRRIDLNRHEPVLLVHIPDNIAAMKSAQMDLACAWRRELREIFLHYFARGYRVEGFFRRSHCNEGGASYVLCRGARHDAE